MKVPMQNYKNVILFEDEFMQG